MSEQRITPSILSGFMELSPEQQVGFDWLKRTIEQRFQEYGFWPLDTPAIEKCEILFSKGGGETSKQVYRIDRQEHRIEQALRFDLTVPLARYVAAHAGELAFPFRRYQIAKVYRGERSQKGRFREFYQCDIDIIGKDRLNLDNDAEMISVMHQIFSDIGLTGVYFRINHRGLLNGYLSYLGVNDTESALRSMDKLEKIGEQQVCEEWASQQMPVEIQQQILNFIRPTESNAETFVQLEKLAKDMECIPCDGEESEAVLSYRKGLEELRSVYERLQRFGVEEECIVIDLSITRGLDYYTGTVVETFLKG